MRPLLVILLVLSLHTVCANGQTVRSPRTVIVRSGSLKLRALLWQPGGRGPFPAVLFSTGSGQTPSLKELGELFSRHGYVFLALYRSGQGLSRTQGVESASRVMRERAAKGDDAANKLQLRLLEGEQLDETRNALALLRSLPRVDQRRISIVGHSFGGSLALLLAESDPAIRAVVNFGGGAGSWPRSSYLRDRLVSAARNLTVPVLYIHTANDYSIAPGEVLTGELARQGKPHRLKLYPAFGETPRDGHNIIYLSIKTWERDVFDFLAEHTAR